MHPSVRPSFHALACAVLALASLVAAPRAAVASAHQVTLTASSTTLIASLNPSGSSQLVTFTATVVGVPPGVTPTGNVTFTVNGSPSVVALVAGVATLSTSGLPVGTSSVSASYAGDANYSASAAGALTQTVLAPESSLPFQFAWGTAGTGAGQIQGAFNLAVNSSRMIYVAERSGNRVQKFDPNGNSVATWGTTGAGNGQFNTPTGIAITAAGNIYVADTGNNRVQRFTADGAYLGQWGTLGTGNGQFTGLGGIAVDSLGNVYTLEIANSRVQKFTSTGTFLAKWGTLGSGNGQFNSPTGIAVTADGHVYVTEVNNHRLQVFTNSGAYVTQWGGAGTAGHGQLFYPRGLTIDRDGGVYITESSCACVQKFTGGGAFLWQTIPAGAFTGIIAAGGTAVDALGNLYAAEPVNDRLMKFAHLPSVTAVTDVRGDQGRQVRLRIAATGADTIGSATPILGYEIYRQIDPANAAARARRGGASPAAVLREGWDYVMTVPARGDTTYYAVVPTLADSNASGPHWSTFFVSATTSIPTANYWSTPDSGWSVDNLPPATPAPFTGAYAAGTTSLHWGRSSEPDFWYYKLYRGASAGFTPSPATLVATRADTGYADPGAAGAWYALSAVDVNGNESGYALLAPGGTLAVGDAAPLAFAITAAGPNPSRGGPLRVAYALAESAPATLELLDVSGRRVAARNAGALGAGRHTQELAAGRALPAGVYLVRLTQRGNSRSLRVVIVN